VRERFRSFEPAYAEPVPDSGSGTSDGRWRVGADALGTTDTGDRSTEVPRVRKPSFTRPFPSVHVADDAWDIR